MTKNVMLWKIRSARISLDRTFLMGVLNVTPDSFSDGGNYLDPEKAVKRALFLIQEGADILDIGAESTRPGASSISAEEEIQRLSPVIEQLSGRIDAPVSVDTTKAEVARAVLKAGAHIINDVSGLAESGAEMAEVIREFGAGLVLMHRRGNPLTMQGLASYQDTAKEVLAELETSFHRALQAGLDPEQIVIDPGLGFAKNAEQNFELIRNLEMFHSLGRPVLLGPSRKSFLGKVTGREAGDREFGTAAVVATAVLKGIQILRVHEPGPMRDVIKTIEAIKGDSHVRTL